MRVRPPLNDIEFVRPLLDMVREYHRTDRARALTTRATNLDDFIAYLCAPDVRHSLAELTE